MAKIYSVKSGKVTEESNKTKKPIFVLNAPQREEKQHVVFDLSSRTIFLILFIVEIF